VAEPVSTVAGIVQAIAIVMMSGLAGGANSIAELTVQIHFVPFHI
jgi:hypothetical protein